MLTKRLEPLIPAVLLSIGCSPESARPPLPAPVPPVATTSLPDSNSPVTWSDSIDAIEVAAIRATNGKVSRVGSELRIQLLDGRTAVFRDETSPGSRFGLPRYAGHLKSIHSHIVHRLPYEGSGVYVIVDDSTGDSTIVYGMPVASPDGTRFALTSMTGEAHYDAGLIEVWRMVGRKPENEFSYDTEKEPWDASDAVWRDSVTIDFIKNSGTDPSEPYIKTPGRLIRTGTTWILVEALH
jgi:hypothetical protein